MITYEQQLNRDRWWALMEGSLHFEKQSAVHKTLLKITQRLEQLGVPYAVAGAMALFFHGYRRFTEDVDLLVSPDGLQKIHRRLDELGFVPSSPGSKNLRDTESGVRVEFLVAGDYPGDGKPKTISFPNPEDAAVELDGVRCLKLPTLVELKLASSSAPRRLRDLADVQELIHVLRLPGEFASQINPTVRDLFLTLWEEVQRIPPEE
jgi:hypothetical protein